MDKGIYVVTNRRLIKDGTLPEIAESSVKGGATAIILREKDLDDYSLMNLAIKVKEKLISSKALFIINGNYKVAKDVDADGVHLSFNMFMNFEEEFDGLLGVSIHSLEEAILAEQKGASYLIAGHIFETSCKESMKGRGVDFLKKICESVKIPVIAIGGISEYNINHIMKCGAYGAAIMSSVMQSEDPENYICKLRHKLDL
ncbi:thiamine phosphate synthase [Clostridium folliculivorans]|uniref:Thiamine phosphate synthase n=1 Tax=Clostridium folliculivorans TaxID=2886038 RepID=A0A9W5XYD8_9CLOT|nr:thiamine phosphate synthase [Clostridium folliculivorans]GKU23263.1 thiamine phosphate synthase [Clostridium folliculivorans]GKU29380.1 thiamine phosphate synthase [Clostridium folliculivorans]